MDLASRIEALLFWRGEPVTFVALGNMLDVTPEEIETALGILRSTLERRGIRLITTDSEATLTTAPEMSDTIDALRKDEMKRDIGKAGAETLAIILYKGPVSRSEIDYIRGVNSSFIIRNLLMRGLIERVEGSDRRAFAYAITPELLAHLGVARKEDLPEYTNVIGSLEQFMRETDSRESDTSQP